MSEQQLYRLLLPLLLSLLLLLTQMARLLFDASSHSSLHETKTFTPLQAAAAEAEKAKETVKAAALQAAAAGLAVAADIL